jgi:hypothetical protein
LNVTNFTTGTRSCWGGKPEVRMPNVNGFFAGASEYNEASSSVSVSVSDVRRKVFLDNDLVTGRL